MFFWLLQPFEAMIMALHSKRYTYILLGIGVIATEAVYSLRVGAVTYSIFASVMLSDWIVPVGAGVLTAFATFVTGYIVATHESKDRKDYAGMIVVIACDWGATVYTVFPTGFPEWSQEGSHYIVCAALCAIGLLPFLLGYWMIAVQPHAIAEKKKHGDDTLEGRKTRRIRKLENLAEKVAVKTIQQDMGLLLNNFLNHAAFEAVKGAVIEANAIVNEIQEEEEYEEIEAPAPLPRIAAPRLRQVNQMLDEEDGFQPGTHSGKLNTQPHTDPLQQRIPTVDEVKRQSAGEDEENIHPLAQGRVKRAGQ